MLDLLGKLLSGVAVRGTRARVAQEGAIPFQCLIQFAAHPVALGDVEQDARILHQRVGGFEVGGRFLVVSEVVGGGASAPFSSCGVLVCFGLRAILIGCRIRSGNPTHGLEQGYCNDEPHVERTIVVPHDVIRNVCFPTAAMMDSGLGPCVSPACTTKRWHSGVLACLERRAPPLAPPRTHPRRLSPIPFCPPWPVARPPTRPCYAPRRCAA